MSFNENWRETKVGNEIELLYGKGLPKKERKKGKTPVYGSNGVTDYHNNYFVEGPGIIIGRKGSIGNPKYCNENFWPIDTTYYVNIKRDNILRFWYYKLLSLPLEDMNSHSAVPGLNRDQVYQLECNIPPLKEQKSIAKILTSLDEKVELNNKMNQTLEVMARAIYKSWFIDFEPWQDGEFVDSELGKIPKGWEVKKMNDLCDISSSKRIYSKEYKEEGIPFYRGKEIIKMKNGEKVSDEIYISRDRYNEIKLKYPVPQKGDILLTSVGTLGVPYKVYDEEFYFKDGNLTWFRNFVQNELSNFIYLWLQSIEGKKNLDFIIIGSTQKALTITSLKKLSIILPDYQVLKKFDKVISKILDKIFFNILEKQILSDIRDTLLPKLMSGEIRVPIEE